LDVYPFPTSHFKIKYGYKLNKYRTKRYRYVYVTVLQNTSVDVFSCLKCTQSYVVSNLLSLGVGCGNKQGRIQSKSSIPPEVTANPNAATGNTERKLYLNL
jgi:hypothetical protein